MELNMVRGQLQVVFPRAQCWSQFCLVPLSVIGMREQAPSVCRWHQVEQECWSAGGWEFSAEGSGQAESVGWGHLSEVLHGEVLGPALGSQQSQAASQAVGRMAGKLLAGKGPGCAGQQPA